MLLLPNFQRTFRLPGPRQTLCLPPDFFDRVAKVRAFIISTKFFCYFSEVFFSLISLTFPSETGQILLKNCRFFRSGLQSYNLYHFYQIFLPFFEVFFLRPLTRIFEELIAFFRSGRQRYEEYFYQQIFSSFFSHTLSTPLFTLLIICYTVCKELIRPFNLHRILFFSSHYLVFRGVCFKSGCKDRQFCIAAKYFCIFF